VLDWATCWEQIPPSLPLASTMSRKRGVVLCARLFRTDKPVFSRSSAQLDSLSWLLVVLCAVDWADCQSTLDTSWPAGRGIGLRKGVRIVLEDPRVSEYERRVSPVERLFTRSPCSIVTMVARIKGGISESVFRDAVSKVRQRHRNLRVRITEDAGGQPWFTSEGAKEIQIEIVPRESDTHWVRVVRESCRIPFEFHTQPAIRFILVQSPVTSDLIILSHHIICDGLSLAYLARDLLVHLGDRTREVELVPDPVPFDRDNIPEDVSLNAVVRFLINRTNKKWEGEKTLFDQEDYRNLTEAYWTHYQHQVLSVELSEAQTLALVDRCRNQAVTVNSALSTAFVGAQTMVQGEKPYHSSVAVAGSLRDRLRRPVGEVMGFYAGLVTLEHKYSSSSGLWENARRFQRRVRPLFNNKNLFKNPLTWCYVDPTILESINFKLIGGLVPRHASRYQKLSDFSARDDVVLSLLRRDNMDSLDRITTGTAVTNLTRLDFPREYGTLELERLIMKPGAAFPLANVNLVLGAATCAGRLSLVIEYVEANVDTGTMERIRDKALELLLGEVG